MNTSCDPVVATSSSSVMSPVNSSGDPPVVSASHLDASHVNSRNSAIPSASYSDGVHVHSSGEPAVSSSSDASEQERPVMKKTPYDFIFGKLIGEGSFSMVYLAKDVHTEREYAIKVCDKLHIVREKKQKAVMREKQIMNMLNDHPSPFFIKLYCAFQDVDRLYFVMNYAINGEMLPYINKVGSFDEKCTKFYTAEIVLALEHLKNLGIAHRDLKPENILLDENMHIQITDFGSAKVLETDSLTNNEGKGNERGKCENEGGDREDANRNKDKDEETKKLQDKSSNKDDKPGSKAEDEENLENKEPSVKLKRRHSFVGTAQYVSPEILTGKNSTCSCDLWALGCIVYQMITGLTPFHAPNEYMMFQKIQKAEYNFPDEFPPTAEDLIKKLLVVKSSERLGASDLQGYPSLKNHPFLYGMPWETLHETTPPCIFKSKGVTSNGEQQNQYKVPDNLEPGLDEKQMTRLLGLGLNEDVKKVTRTSSKTIVDLSPEEMAQKLELQAKENPWHKFVEGNIILMQGIVNKQKGLFPKRRMLLLTTGPHLYYVDPANMVLKGEIPWTPELRSEAKSFKMFSINTPDRSYNMEDPEANALKWYKAIQEVHKRTFGEQS